MFGQWIGGIKGTNEGMIVLNVDHDRTATGVLQVLDKLPTSIDVRLEVTDSSVTGKLIGFNPHVSPLPPDARVPTDGEFRGHRDGDVLTGTWRTNIDTNGSFDLLRRDLPNALASHHVFSWNEFRAWALDTSFIPDKWLFRGHSDNTYPLTTAFHRTGRRDLLRYAREDVPLLHRSVEAALGKPYDLARAADYGALLHLAQHHGFPTPLLDWTESPFVAAYFAFEAVPKMLKSTTSHVRLFALDYQAWPFHRVQAIDDMGLIFARLFLGVRDNPRALPQQSVSLFSSIVDIENYVAFHEQRTNQSMLLRIDIPVEERRFAMRELETMGITHASLFPGLDGACKALAEARF